MDSKKDEESCEGMIRSENNDGIHFKFKVQEETEFPYVLPASCNWYCPSIVSCMNGYCAVGGKNAVFMFNLQVHPPVCEWDMGVSTSLSVKVTAVALMTGDGNLGPATPQYVAVGLEDGLIRIFVIQSKTILKEHRKHLSKITAMSWAPITHKLILTGDNKGNLSVWDYQGNSIQMWNPIPAQIICLQTCPVKPSFFIVGYHNGNIIVGDTEKLEVLLTLKSHLDEITSLSWCPVARDGKFLFVSGSKDRTIRVWEVMQEKSVAIFSIPKRNYGKKKEMPKTSFFVAVLWLNEKQIISGLQNGEVLSWDDDGNSNVIGHAHDRIIFTLCNDLLTNQFVSVSMDRQLIVWNGHRLSPSFKIPTLGGFVYSLSTPVNNPYSVAIGVGDNMMRIVSSNGNKGYNSRKLWEGIKSKVTVVSYHPSYDGIIGYGTEGGHVACYSLSSHKSDISTTYHKKVVYSLCWGPHFPCADVSGEHLKINCLYTVGGEGTVLMHRMGAFNHDACNIGQLIRKHNDLKNVPVRSDLAWRADYSYFALGNGDGSIDLFKNDSFKLVVSVSCHKKMINCMSWHHNYSFSEEGVCYSAWLASGSNGDMVCVSDFSNVIGDAENVSKLLRPYRQLSGHSHRITRVMWNPHKNASLASSSFDGSVKIWDVEKNVLLANFNGHIGRVYTVLWSYLDGDILYSGGEDFTLRRWKVSLQSSAAPATAKKSKPKKKKKPDEENKEGHVTHTNAIIEEVGTNLSSLSIQPEVNGVDDCKSKVEEVTSEQKVPKQVLTMPTEIAVNVVPRESRENRGDGAKRKKVKSLLKKMSQTDGKKKESMQDDCVLLAKYLKAHEEDKATCKEKSGVDPTSEENINLSMFTTRHDAHALVAVECRGHEGNGFLDQLTQLEVWRNNIGGLLDKATEQSFLSETMLALAPLGGYDMWKAAMLAYAKQLESKQRWHHSALYYLAIGEVHKAIRLLKENGYFKEALIMAKVQLGSDDPLIKELYIERGKKLSDDCNYEQAAECFLAANCVKDAVAVLGKRVEGSSLLTAVRIASIYELEEHFPNLLTRAIHLLYQEHKWSLLHELLPRCTRVELINFQAIVGEFLMEHLIGTELVLSHSPAVDNHKKYKFYANNPTRYPDHVNSSKLSLSPSSFLVQALYTLGKTCNFTRKTSTNFDHISIQQLQCRRTSVANLSAAEVWAHVANSILHGIICLVNGDCSGCFQKWLTAFDILECSGNQSSMLALFDTLFPNHYNSLDEIIQTFHDSDTYDKSDVTLSSARQLYRNFMAFRCSSIMYNMWYRMGSLRKEDFLKENSTHNVENNGLSAGNPTISLGQSSRECEFYCIVTNSYSCISWLASVLLSDTHFSFAKLQSELKYLDEQLLGFDIKRRLNEHIQSRKHGHTKKQKASTDTKPAVEEDVAFEVHRVCNGMVNVVDILAENDRSDLCNRMGNAVKNMENEMITSYLVGKKSLLMRKFDMLSSDMKDYAFPLVADSFSILMLLCISCHAYDGRLNSILNDIYTWGEEHGLLVGKNRYVRTLMESLQGGFDH